jgi:hypothetical protein
VRGLPHRRVVHAEIAAYGADDHLPRVQADADVGAHGLRPPERFGVAGHGLLHLERRVTGAHGVVLVGDRRAEQGHDPVTHHLVDGALVTVDGFHHPLEHWIEELPGLLGVSVGEELHGALEVGEEDSDLLALALEGGLRGENPFGQVFRRINLWRGEPRLGVIANGERRCALPAELVARRIGRATGRTDRRKRSGTLAAELHASGILSLAPGTAHQSNAFVVCSAFSR